MTPTPNGATARNDAKGSGLGRTMAGYIDSTLSWGDIKWLKRCTRLPIVLKGVQTVEDALMAVEHGIDGLVLGNHGGRSLDTSTPSLMILLDLQKRCPDIFNHIEVYVDGGIRRGTDIFKALCLGARAVGMGRHFLYAANYGPEGVEQLIDSKLYLPNSLELQQVESVFANTMLHSHAGRVRDDDAHDGMHRAVATSPGAAQPLRCEPLVCR